MGSNDFFSFAWQKKVGRITECMYLIENRLRIKLQFLFPSWNRRNSSISWDRLIFFSFFYAGDYWVDLGGQWVHGEEDNVVYELAWRLGLLEHWGFDSNITLLSSSGSAISQPIANDLFELFLNLTNSATPEEYVGRSEGEFYRLKLRNSF